MRRDRKGATTTTASRLLLGALAAVSIAGAALPSAAASWGAAPYMREGEEVRGPSGYYELCKRAPWDCPSPAPISSAKFDMRITLDEQTLTTLEILNRTMNQAYEPVTDYERYGVSDLWTMPTETADCEDYVLAKRAALIGAGWPEAALLIGVVRGEAAPYHAVLIVRTDKGELVLDNLTDEIRDWRDSGYEWVVRQSLTDPNRWVRILDGAPERPGAGAMQPATLLRDGATPPSALRPNAR